MMVDPVFRYNPPHSVREGLDLVDPEPAQGIEKAQAGAGEKNRRVVSSRMFSPGVGLPPGGLCR